MRYRPLLALAALLTTLVLVVACGGEEGAAGGADTTTEAAATEAAFPVTVAGANGELTLEERPQRIVSLSPTATETLFALGAGDLVVAVDDQSNFPQEAPRTDLSGFEPSVEAIAGYQPDLVIASFDPGSLVDGLGRLDIPVLLQPAAADLEDAYAQIEALGAATGLGGEAEELVADMRGRLEELSESADAAGTSVYHELGPDYFSATSDTFAGAVYELFGLENIADEAGGQAPDYPQLSAEYILEADPDVIVLADTKCCDQSLQTLRQRPGWRTLTAVREGHVVEADDDVASRWGPRTVEFAELVAAALSEVAER